MSRSPAPLARRHPSAADESTEPAASTIAEQSPPRLEPKKVTKITAADLRAERRRREALQRRRTSQRPRRTNEPEAKTPGERAPEGARLDEQDATSDTETDRSRSPGGQSSPRGGGAAAGGYSTGAKGTSSPRGGGAASPSLFDWRSLLVSGDLEDGSEASLAGEGKESLLQSLARDLTEAALAGELDPVIGRDREIERIVDTLNRRRANVPCLVGEPGVGKTAIVEGLASRLARGEVPGLEGRVILQVDVGELVAGTGVRGALSERLGRLRQEVARFEGRVVVFLDDVHSLLAAAGGAGGEGSQELRAAMASGDFPCIMATTTDAYRRFVEPDPTLERRLTRVEIEEPDEEESLRILRAGIERYAEHHQVRYGAEVIEAALRLTHRYMTERRLPDKAFSVLDLAGARAHRLGLREVPLEVLHGVIAESSGVPVERLAATDAQRLLELERRLSERIIGHEDNLRRIAAALRRNAAGLGGRRPVGSFLMLGPTGVGKTETARALADELFPGGGGMTRVDMSELSEAHSVARLVGAPPGYVGHESGGQLTEAVRARPYQVVLLDEIEKAHPRVHMLLLQILEDGRLTDGRGRLVDFTHTIVIMTSNLGVKTSASAPIGFASARSEGELDTGAATLRAARATLPPELWNRFDEVLYFAPLDRSQVAEVARLLLRQTARKLADERSIELRWDDEVVDWLLDSGGYDPALGARPMRRAIQRLVEAPIAEAVLRQGVTAGQTLRLRLGAKGIEARLQ